MSDQKMELFKVKFDASTRRFEMLYDQGKPEDMIELMRKMIREANSIQITALDSLDEKLQKLLQTNQSKLNKLLQNSHRCSIEFFDAIDTLKAYNNKQSKEATKALLETLNAREGISKFKRDTKQYRKELFSFYDKYSDVFQKHQDSTERQLLTLSSELSLCAEKIAADNIYQIVKELEKLCVDNQKELQSFLQKYKDTLAV